MTAVLTSFVGARLCESIPFDPLRLHDGRMIHGIINLTEEDIGELECLAEEEDEEPSPAYSGPGRRDPFRVDTGLPSLDDYDTLRQMVDSNDSLMGARIVGPRSYRGRLIPTWAMSDKKVQNLLLSVFPRMKEDSTAGRRQRESAARWNGVIQLYFRMKYTCADVAEALYSTQCKVKNVIRSIQRVVRGRRAGSRKLRTNNRGANLRGPQHPRRKRSR